MTIGISVVRVSSPAHGLVPVHIGEPEPGSDQERDWRRVRGWQRVRLVPDQLDWQKHGLQPRWLGMETGDCAAALVPGAFVGGGTSERDRFLAGARLRGEQIGRAHV